MPLTPQRACQLLAVHLPPLDGCATVQAAQERLQAWKDGPLRTAYRAAAKACHPDLGPADELAARTERMGLVSRAHTMLRDELNVRVHQPRPVVRVVVRQGFLVLIHMTLPSSFLISQ